MHAFGFGQLQHYYTTPSSTALQRDYINIPAMAGTYTCTLMMLDHKLSAQLLLCWWCNIPVTTATMKTTGFTIIG